MKSLSGIEGRVMEEKKGRRKKELNKLKDLWKKSYENVSLYKVVKI